VTSFSCLLGILHDSRQKKRTYDDVCIHAATHVSSGSLDPFRRKAFPVADCVKEGKKKEKKKRKRKRGRRRQEEPRIKKRSCRKRY